MLSLFVCLRKKKFKVLSQQLHRNNLLLIDLEPHHPDVHDPFIYLLAA